jgi:hypothetical protein
MALSLGILIVPIALLLIFYRVFFDGDAPVTVDAGPVLQEARQAAAFPVVAPAGLGSDWHTSSATFGTTAGGATLRIGYVDPGKDPLQLVESSVATTTLIREELTAAAQPQMTSFRTANGVWRLYNGRPGEKALVLADGSRTIIVVGKADESSLEKLAASLG